MIITSTFHRNIPCFFCSFGMYVAKETFVPGFGRKKMVALALLCGCDYGIGACGSSINTVVSFLHTVPDDKIIHRY